ncbi:MULTISPECIES: TetR family transcriptional regulator [unclassified Embleya]
MTADAKPPTSARRDELLAASVAYVAEHGLAELSLRPLARAIGSSPRVLLYLFGSKEGLIREILEVGRAEQLALVTRADGRPGTARDTLDLLWTWLVAPERRGALRLFFDGYVRSFQGDAPWSDFTVASLDEWLPPTRPRPGRPPSPLNPGPGHPPRPPPGPPGRHRPEPHPPRTGRVDRLPRQLLPIPLTRGGRVLGWDSPTAFPNGSSTSDARCALGRGWPVRGRSESVVGRRRRAGLRDGGLPARLACCSAKKRPAAADREGARVGFAGRAFPSGPGASSGGGALGRGCRCGACQSRWWNAAGVPGSKAEGSRRDWRVARRKSGRQRRAWRALGSGSPGVRSGVGRAGHFFEVQWAGVEREFTKPDGVGCRGLGVGENRRSARRGERLGCLGIRFRLSLGTFGRLDGLFGVAVLEAGSECAVSVSAPALRGSERTKPALVARLSAPTSQNGRSPSLEAHNHPSRSGFEPQLPSNTPATSRPTREGSPEGTTRALSRPRCRPVFADQHARLAASPESRTPARRRRPTTHSDQPRNSHPQPQAQRAPKPPDPLQNAPPVNPTRAPTPPAAAGRF